MNTPGEDLIDYLEDLRLNLNSLRERLEKSGVERTKGLRDAMGNDCKFYRKSLGLFLERDYLDIKQRVADIHSLFNLIEGNHE
jgi:hypothetical protein